MNLMKDSFALVGIVNAFHLKVAMCILMVLSHVWLFIPGAPYEFHIGGRLVAPVFAFLVAQGMVYTRDRQKYIARLMLFSAATFLGNSLLGFIYGKGPTMNILLSYAVAAQLIVVVDNHIADKKPMWLMAAAILAAVALLFEGAWVVTAPVLIFYYLRHRPRLMFAVYVASVPVVLWLLEILIGFYSPGQWAMVFAVMPLMLYDGKRGTGNGSFIKYFFYAFYPLHIWIIFIISRFI